MIAVVLGYGCNAASEVYQEYIAYVARRIAVFDISHVIVTGGYTNRYSNFGSSEAAVMAKMLRACGVTVPIIEENLARTTSENLQFAHAVLWRHRLEGSELVIFCDAMREFKVRWLASMIFGWRYQFKVTGFDFGQSVRVKLLQWTRSLAVDVLSHHIPFVWRLKHRWKEDHMNKS